MKVFAYMLIGRRKGRQRIRNVKMLTVAQLVTMIIVFVVVFIYNTLRPAESHKAFGMVEGVIYGTGTPSALIDGQVIREGEEIYGVRVIKIHRDKVEFEGGGKRWEQCVREQPSPAWEEPNQIQVYTDTTDLQ